MGRFDVPGFRGVALVNLIHEFDLAGVQKWGLRVAEWPKPGALPLNMFFKGWDAPLIPTTPSRLDEAQGPRPHKGRLGAARGALL